jgi:hypothetical protein
MKDQRIKFNLLLLGIGILAVSVPILTSGCGLIVASVIPQSSTSNTTTTITLPGGASFIVSGTVNRGAVTILPTVEGAVALFKNKSDLQSDSGRPVSMEVKSFTGDSFSYSVGTTEGGTYYIIAFYPGDKNGTPEGAGGPGITGDGGADSILNALQSINLTSQSTTVNMTLYRITGP